MPDAASPAAAVLADLGYVLFARKEEGALQLLGKVPAWLSRLWPALTPESGRLPVADASPFLENFLIDAEECWQKGDVKRAQSGPWVEQSATDGELQLEATAMTVDGQPLLLLERLGEAFEAKKSVLQRARETVIAHQRLNSEIQKKEILLHCVADEMTAALANIITSLRLIELEDNGPRTKMLLGLATRASEEQQTLIHRILAVFENELGGGLTTAGSEAYAALGRAVDQAAPLFAEKGVRLESPDAAAGQALVAVAPAQLERVMSNLLENALERTPSGGLVKITATEEPEALLWQVEDNGTTAEAEAGVDLFVKWDPTQPVSPTAALRLHFCRIVAENCGGEMGGERIAGGGNRCWIRLTTSTAT
ncbi:MAG: HAMP domain-containing histidine kinase [Verrucomicrobiota bacterium]|nr:HAMP domain-containing histidine kinase [Verrucomicrobiota bacterium]